MDVLGRYRNLIVLVGVLFAQVLGLAVQVKRTNDSESTRVIRIWAVGAVTPLEKALVWMQTSTGKIWHSYFYLRGVRAENRSLKAQIERMSLEQVRNVYPSTSQVLLIDDQTSGVGAILDKTRLQGILRGTPSGEVVLEKVMSDETVPPGEQVLTSGGDGIFPKGLLVGRVTKVSTGSDLFLNIRVRPAADLSKLEEVLVVTKIDERQAEPERTSAARAV